MPIGAVGKVRDLENFRDTSFERVPTLISSRPYWGVLIYKSVSDPNVTKIQPDINFRGRTTYIGSNLILVRFARVKNFLFNFLLF